MKQNISGIYAIINKTNNKRYIGSSKSVYYRWSQNHLVQLRHSIHFNRHLQSAWNKYGENNFEFIVIEECNISLLLEKEGYWIEYYKSWEREHGYNLNRVVDEKQVLSQESIKKTIETKNIENYWTTGTNAKIIELFNEGESKNFIAIKLGVTRSAVYSCLEQNDLYHNTGRGNEIKLTEEVKQQVQELRDQNNTVAEICKITGVSETQLRRTETIVEDNKYGGKVKRETYRTVTPDVIAKVEILRAEGKKWEDIEKEIGVSRFALHQNGVTDMFKNPNARKGIKLQKVTREKEEEIYRLLLDKKTVTEIHNITNIPKSTIRLRKKGRQGTNESQKTSH